MITSGKDVVRQSYECFSAHDLDGLAKLLDDGFTLHDRNEGEVYRGKDAGLAWFRQYLDAFPDMRVEAVDIISEGDLVSARWVARGRNDGPLEDMEPTHREVEVHGIEIDRVRNGKIVETWQQWDAMGFYEQLGLLESQAMTSR